ncbi:MAG: SUMF1/EgtB/PvdO family nonheme iron enzyme [Planctomycetes bacterium]|nr:SUMF1/EgtB/PvdO family nonheme iron enzyme [Planctomycetota bacterium]
MQTDDRDHRITELVEGYLQGGVALEDYLSRVEADLRDEVRAQCEDAGFIGQFFAGLPQPSRQPEVPHRIGGCELIELLGAGAMGEVHRARQIDLDRPVAVKLVRGEVSHRDDYRERFRQEAHVLASLDHPNIVKVLSYGEERGWRFFVMDLVHGRDLGSAVPELRDAFDADATRAGDRIARIAAELLETLAYAHGRGVVHRDLKPANVVLDANDHPHLVDFGLSKARDEDPPGWQVRTVPGLLLGTPAYWSPEVAARRPFERESPDIWAAGVMLFQMLTGSLPYGDVSTDRLIATLGAPTNLDPRTLSPNVPAPLAAICSKALAPDPGERYATAQEFATDLRRFLARQPVLAEQLQPFAQLVRHIWRRRHLYAAGLVLGAGAAGIWWAAEAATAQAAVRDAASQLIEVAGDDSQPLSALAGQAARARELLASGRLNAPLANTLAQTLAHIEDRARQQRLEGRRLIERGAGSPPGTPRTQVAAPNAAMQMRGLQRTSVAAVVLGEEPDELGMLGAAFPILQVQSPVGGGPTAVRIDALEPIGGQPLLNVVTGVTPLEIPLAPGDYRIVVGGGDAFAECARTLGPPGVTVVTPRLLANAMVESDMILVPAGTAVVGQDHPEAYIYTSQTVAHDAYWIDRTEVTCGAYRTFCLETGTEPPRTWAGNYESAWHDLPVVGVTAAEAVAYAEWAGKRLPTWTEWQVAARGAVGARFPWGDDPEPLATVATIGGDPAVQWYGGVHAVGTEPLDTSWCGAHDMLGNIDEWTSTAYVAQFAGMPFPVYPWRLRAGASWESKRDRYAALDVVSPGQPEWFGTGFRCAKSANP